MNRKIVFRGYNLKNKQWIYGYYLVNRGKHYIVQDEVVEPFKEESDFEVDAESVGQFVITIGSQDFYEGDVVFAIASCSGNMYKGVVRYDDESSEFGIFDNDDESFIPLSAKPVAFIKTDETDLFFYEVIGNEYEEKLKIITP